MEQVLIVYDDLDLDVGAVRLRAKGGAGGHNGMRSIQQRLGGNSNIPRLKIGIGRPTTAQPIASYVLEVSNAGRSSGNLCTLLDKLLGATRTGVCKVSTVISCSMFSTYVGGAVCSLLMWVVQYVLYLRGW